MKTQITKLFSAVLASAVLGLMVLTAPAQTIGQYSAQPMDNFHALVAPTDPMTNTTAAGGTNTIPGLGYSNAIPVQSFLIRPGFGIAFTTVVTNTASVNGSLTYSFHFSDDGTNWDSLTNFQWTIALTGTNVLTYTTNLTDTWVTGHKSIALYTVTNTSASGAASINLLELSRPIPWNPSPRGY